jgi:hypothetical protein
MTLIVPHDSGCMSQFWSYISPSQRQLKLRRLSHHACNHKFVQAGIAAHHQVWLHDSDIQSKISAQIRAAWWSTMEACAHERSIIPVKGTRFELTAQRTTRQCHLQSPVKKKMTCWILLLIFTLNLEQHFRGVAKIQKFTFWRLQDLDFQTNSSGDLIWESGLYLCSAHEFY